MSNSTELWSFLEDQRGHGTDQVCRSHKASPHAESSGYCLIHVFLDLWAGASITYISLACKNHMILPVSSVFTLGQPHWGGNGYVLGNGLSAKRRENLPLSLPVTMNILWGSGKKNLQANKPKNIFHVIKSVTLRGTDLKNKWANTPQSDILKAW